MTWTYKQSTGELFHDGNFVAKGYAGAPEGKNDPGKQAVKNVGPLPRGGYHIGKPRDSELRGPKVLPLTPLSCTDTFGRSAFLIHGDSKTEPGAASHGCIIMPRMVRDQIATSGDTTLEVVE